MTVTIVGSFLFKVARRRFDSCFWGQTPDVRDSRRRAFRGGAHHAVAAFGPLQPNGNALTKCQVGYFWDLH